MPAIVVSDEGERELLRRDLCDGDPDPRGWWLHLYKNDYIPKRDVELADLVEATYPGYLSVELAEDGWGEPATIGGQAVSYYGIEFIQFLASSGSNPVYGYFLTFNEGASLLWAQRFNFAPINVTTVTPALVWPVLAGRSQSEPPP